VGGGKWLGKMGKWPGKSPSSVVGGEGCVKVLLFAWHKQSN